MTCYLAFRRRSSHEHAVRAGVFRLCRWAVSTTTCRRSERSPSCWTYDWPKPRRPPGRQRYHLRTPALQAVAGCARVELSGAWRPPPALVVGQHLYEQVLPCSFGLATGAPRNTEHAPTSGVRRPRRSRMSGGARPSHRGRRGHTATSSTPTRLWMLRCRGSHLQRVMAPQPHVEL